MFTLITAILQNKKGQGMVEYGLILALVSVAAILTLTPLGTAIGTQFTTVTGQL